jgi:hypothetical protein
VFKLLKECILILVERKYITMVQIQLQIVVIYHSYYGVVKSALSYSRNKLRELGLLQENKEGIPHYTADGELYEGPTHKDSEGRLMTGEEHNEDSEYLYHKEELEAQPSVTSTYPGQAASGSIAPALLK